MERPYIGNAPAETPVQGQDIAAGTVPFAALDKTTVPTALGYLSSRRRNINGAMEIDQANAGAAVTVNSAALAYGVDQWDGFGTTSAGVFTMQQSSASPPAGFKNYLHVVVGTADASPVSGSAYRLRCPIEGQNLVDFNLGLASAIPFTLSFWVRSSLTGQFSGSFRNGITANRSYPFTFNINLANTWEYKTVVVAQGDVTGTWVTDNTEGFDIFFDLGDGSTFRSTAGTWQAGGFHGVTGAVRLISTLSATFDLTGVQIEPGANVTPYERRFISEELARCQRYYVKTFSQGVKPSNTSNDSSGALPGGGQTSSGGNMEPNVYWAFPVDMRIAPTVTQFTFSSTGTAGQWRDGGNTVSTANARNIFSGTRGVTIDNGGTTVAQGDWLIHATADARL